jgi:hypothetical protein
MIKRVVHVTKKSMTTTKTDVSQPTNELPDLYELRNLYEEVLRLRELEAQLLAKGRDQS